MAAIVSPYGRQVTSPQSVPDLVPRGAPALAACPQVCAPHDDLTRLHSQSWAGTLPLHAFFGQLPISSPSTVLELLAAVHKCPKG